MYEPTAHVGGPRGAKVKQAFAAVILAYCVAFMSFTTLLRAEAPPNQQQVEFAQRTSDLMLATVVGALLQEFAETTPANVEEGKKSISLIFNDRNDDMRLVGLLDPLRDNDVPQDSFEALALDRAMRGQNTTDRKSTRLNSSH